MLGAPVRRIEHGADGVTVHADGAVARGRRAILAIAPTLAGRIAYDPPLPGYRDQLTQRMPLGTVAKCMALYDEPFWRSEGLSGQAHERPRPGAAHLRQLAARRLARRAARLPRGPPRARARAAARRTSAGRAVIDCFARIFGPRAASPDDYVERLWAEEEWTRGCYGCHMPTGAWTELRPRAARADRPAALGRAPSTRTVWNGYMDGAVRSGEAAAAEVLELLV